MKKLFFLISICITCNLIAQETKELSLMEVTNYDKVYHKIIDNKHPITIYLRYSEPHIPSYDLYSRYCVVKGWYQYDKYQHKIPLIGIYSASSNDLSIYVPEKAIDTLSIYVPNKKEAIEQMSINEEKDWISILDKLDYKESFKFSSYKNKAEWSDKNKTLSVTAMNFNEFPIQKKIYLSISENSKKEYIDLFKILQLSDLDFAGLNGWAYSTIKLREYTIVDKGINVLLDATFENTARCNGSLYGIYCIELDENNLVKNIDYINTDSCNNYYSLRDENDSKNKYNVVAGDIHQKDTIGEYSIVDSKIIITKNWIQN